MQADQLARYDALLHRIYDAALRPESWPAVLADIATANGASHALLYTPVHMPVQGGFLFPHNIPQSSLDLWAARGIREDPLVAAAIARGYIAKGEGVAMSGDQLVPEAELLTTSFYREHWAPIGIGRVCSGMVFDGTDAHKLPTILAVYRRLADPHFDDKQVELVRRLLAHVSRALGVMFHLRDSRLQAASTTTALDRLSAGIFLLSQDRAIRFANAAGQSMLDRGDPLCSDGVGLGLTRRLKALDAQFRRCIADAVHPFDIEADAAHFSQAMVLPDRAGRPSCVLHAAPLGQAATFQTGVSRPAAIVFAHDVAAAAAVAPEKLTALFGLTSAEARAALQIMEGGGGDAMASRLGVSINTFRTQLKAAYAKTGTNRQTDLLKLLLALSSAS